MRIVSSLCIIAAILTSCSSAEKKVDRKAVEIAQLKKDLGYLASDLLEGRATGSEGEKLAADYISSRFKALGLEPKGDNGWFQPFVFKPQEPAHNYGSGDSTTLEMALVKEIHGKNVIAFLDNHAKNTIVIGAHYDHLGWGSINSLHASRDSAIHNGADDNASGVSAMLLLAKRLKEKGINISNNYLFIAFSGEENGLWGSNHFCDEPTIDLKSVNYMMNMDMVGRLNEDKILAVYGTGTSPTWRPNLDSLAVDSITITREESGIGPSDHTSFYLQDLPVLHFFTGQHEDYHKPTDDVEKINWEGIISVSNYMETLITWLDDEPKLTFTKTKDEKEDTPNFKVTLGVMPDYLFGGPGMRIDGVQEGRTADKAGMLKEDVILAIGDKEVVGMRDYMECLSQYESGEKATVKVDRGGEIMEIDVIWD